MKEIFLNLIKLTRYLVSKGQLGDLNFLRQLVIVFRSQLFEGGGIVKQKYYSFQ